MPALVVTDLKKRFGSVEVLSGVSLTLERGEFVAVLGQSGAGKSTLFRCITRLTEPDAGEIYIDGRPIHGLSESGLAAARRNIGVVFQQFNLIRRRTALQNVMSGRLGEAPLWRVLSGTFAQQDQDRASSALEAVGLSMLADQRADTLSGGQQQRVAIARALAQESLVLLADEPVASLDPDTAEEVLGLLRSLARSRGLAVLCSLHQPQLAERYADRVLTMREGKLIGRALRRRIAGRDAT